MSHMCEKMYRFEFQLSGCRQIDIVFMKFLTFDILIKMTFLQIGKWGQAMS